MADDVDVSELRARMADGAVVGVYRAGEDLLGRATRLAPVDEGTLRGSGALTMIVNGQRFEGSGALALARRFATTLAKAGRKVDVDVEVSFNTVYAARQHEELDWHHPKGGEAKYLEKPLLANVRRYERMIGKAVDLSAAGGTL